MASRLARAGEDVTVWNRTRAKAEALTDVGCTVADTIADLRGPTWSSRWSRPRPTSSRCSPATAGCSPTPTRCRDRHRLLDGLHRGVGRDARGVRPSAASRSSPRRSAATPRSSGRAASASSCPAREETYDGSRPLLDHLGKGATYVGEGELARLAKICHNVMLGVVTQSLAEITVLAEKGGISRAAFLEFLNNSVMGSVFTRYKSPAFVNLDFTPTFTPILLRKDFDLGFAAAHDLDVPMPVAAAAAAAVQAERQQRPGRGGLRDPARAAGRELRDRRSSRRTSPSTTGWRG